MPEETLDHLKDAQQKMEQAEKALGTGDGPNAVSREKEAQRLLEMAQNESDRPDDGKQSEQQQQSPRDNGEHDAGNKHSRQKVKIPGKDEHKDPVDFRKRVLEGIGGTHPADPHLRDAIKRYAEGLLK